MIHSVLVLFLSISFMYYTAKIDESNPMQSSEIIHLSYLPQIIHSRRRSLVQKRKDKIADQRLSQSTILKMLTILSLEWHPCICFQKDDKDSCKKQMYSLLQNEIDKYMETTPIEAIPTEITSTEVTPIENKEDKREHVKEPSKESAKTLSFPIDQEIEQQPISIERQEDGKKENTKKEDKKKLEPKNNIYAIGKRNLDDILKISKKDKIIKYKYTKEDDKYDIRSFKSLTDILLIILHNSSRGLINNKIIFHYIMLVELCMIAILMFSILYRLDDINDSLYTKIKIILLIVFFSLLIYYLFFIFFVIYAFNEYNENHQVTLLYIGNLVISICMSLSFIFILLKKRLDTRIRVQKQVFISNIFTIFIVVILGSMYELYYMYGYAFIQKIVATGVFLLVFNMCMVSIIICGLLVESTAIERKNRLLYVVPSIVFISLGYLFFFFKAHEYCKTN